MELINQFSVEVPADLAFSTLLDIERVASCLPGAVITGRSGDRYTGEVAVKLGPVSIKYAGEIEVIERDSDTRSAVLMAHGRETGSPGTVSARFTMDVSGDDRAEVHVRTELDIRGKAAQFGRGLLESVARRIIAQFAANLEAMLTSDEGGGAAGASAGAGACESMSNARAPRSASLSIPGLTLGPGAIPGRDAIVGAVLGFLAAFVLLRLRNRDRVRVILVDRTLRWPDPGDGR